MEYFAENRVPALRLGAPEVAPVYLGAATFPFGFDGTSSSILVEKKARDFVGFLSLSSKSTRAMGTLGAPTSVFSVNITLTSWAAKIIRAFLTGKVIRDTDR